MKIKFENNYSELVSVDNLLNAWQEFIKGKRSRVDVQEFELRLMDNIIELHQDLTAHTYGHSSYKDFFINDSKRRHIHKAGVRDRLLHHAIYRVLYPFFDKTFISDSFSCRLDKGTHKAIKRFQCFAGKVSRNHHRTCWVLKGDIKKFFDSIDHDVLIKILSGYIVDKNILALLENIINSFPQDSKEKLGLPLGNLTSQLFANVYMNVFDQFVKHKLKAKYYIRYADDFVILSENKEWLESTIPLIKNFLTTHLRLELHPDKLFIKTIFSGMDFLGWVNFPEHRTLRTTTKRRMFKRIKNNPSRSVVDSYLGLLKHGNGENIRREFFAGFGGSLKNENVKSKMEN